MSKVVELCGDTPQDFEKVDFSSNPDFVFENDINFSSKQLFDSEGNTVFVNSFIECEHYVSGGWDYSPLKNNEIQLQDITFYIVIFLLVVTYTRNLIKKIFIK